MTADVKRSVPSTVCTTRQARGRRPVDNGVPTVCGKADNGYVTTAKSPGDGCNRPGATTESPQQGDPMNASVPPAVRPDHPACPICAAGHARVSEHVEGTRWTALYLCTNNHLYQLAWTVVA